MTPPSPGLAFGEVTAEGEPLAPYVADSADPAIGQVAPTLTGIDPAGDPVTIDPGAEGPMVIAFVAHWCPHCQAEVPRLVDLADEAASSTG
ncbi:MAG: TlpA family protein disulfide reductase [Iamia sp.]